MKSTFTSITKSRGRSKYNCTITISPDIVPKFMDLLGVQMLQGQRIELSNGQIQFDFNADDEAIRIIKDMFNMISGFSFNDN